MKKCLRFLTPNEAVATGLSTNCMLFIPQDGELFLFLPSGSNWEELLPDDDLSWIKEQLHKYWENENGH